MGSEDAQVAYGLFLIGVIILLIILYIVWCNWVGKTASQKGRTHFGWFLFSLFFSPIWGMLLVSLLPETRKSRMKRIQEEEMLKRRIWEDGNSLPNSGKSIADKYRES